MKKLTEKLVLVETYIAAACMASSTLIMFLGAVLRGFKHPINWSLDISLFLFAWCVFLSADVAMKHSRLVNVDMLISHLPARVRKVLAVFCYLTILVFLIAMVIVGAKLTWTTRIRTFQGIPGFSYAWVTLSLPVGFALMTGTVVNKLRHMLFDRRRGEAAGNAEN